MAPGNRNRGRLDDVALDPALDKQAMNPKAVQSSLLNDHNLHRDAMALLGLRLQARKKDEQRSAVTARNDMLGTFSSPGLLAVTSHFALLNSAEATSSGGRSHGSR